MLQRFEPIFEAELWFSEKITFYKEPLTVLFGLACSVARRDILQESGDALYV